MPIIRFLLTGLLVLTGCLATPAQTAESTEAEERAIRALVARYLDAWTRRELDTLMDCWTGLEADRTRRREQMQRRFAENEDKFTEPKFSRWNIRFSAATVYVQTTRRTRKLANPAEGELTPVHFTFTLAKEDIWRIVREQPATSAFLLELLAAPAPEQERMLASERQLVNAELARLLASQSDQMFLRGNQTAALAALRLLRPVAERLNDRIALADAWLNTGIAEFVLGNYDRAQEAYQQAITLNRQLQRAAPQARALTNLGALASERKQPRQALSYYEQALQLFTAANERSDVLATHEASGDSWMELGETAKALASYRASLGAASDKPSASIANRYLKLARHAYEYGDDHNALQAYEQALDQLERAGQRQQRGHVLHSIANLYYTQGDWGQALRFYQRSLTAETEISSAHGQAAAQQGIGLVHSLNGNYAAALTAFQANAAYWQTRPEKSEQAAALQRVAATQFALGQYAEARMLYQQVVTVRAALGDIYEHARALLDLGIVHATVGEFATALELYAQSRTHFTEIN